MAGAHIEESVEFLNLHTYNDASFDAEISVLVEPDLDTRLGLEELEDQEL